MESHRYYRSFAAAYVRGVCPGLSALDDDRALEEGRAKGLRLHSFKRTAGLARVRRVLGILKGFAPRTLLDVGSGRGAFLWPLLDEIDGVEVTAIDVRADRVDAIDAVRRGGVHRVRAFAMPAERLAWQDDSFDAVTVLEVLEHVADPAPVAAEAVRVARHVVIATVPAKEDDNPEHIRLFSRDSLGGLFRSAGASSVRIEHVLNHRIAVVRP